MLGHTARHKAWMLPAAALAFVVLAAAATPAPGAGTEHRRRYRLSGGAVPVVRAIIEARCAVCHALHPTMPGFDEPPQSVVLQTAEQIVQEAPLIDKMAVTTDAMPLGNATGMTAEERTILGRWIAAGAKR